MRIFKFFLLLVFMAISGNLFSQVVLPESIEVEEGKPVMVMLTASWCGPCKIAKEKVLTDNAWDYAAGISFDSWGAKSGMGGKVPVEYFIRVPLEVERHVKRIYSNNGLALGDFKLRGGVWGGFAIANDTPFETRKTDAGLQTAIVFQMGSFDISAGYIRGFVDRISAHGIQAFNNAVTIGISLN